VARRSKSSPNVLGWAVLVAAVGMVLFMRKKATASQPMVPAMAAPMPTVSAPLPQTVTTPVPSYQELYMSQVHTVTG
jgi:hypothetical protein